MEHPGRPGDVPSALRFDQIDGAAIAPHISRNETQVGDESGNGDWTEQLDGLCTELDRRQVEQLKPPVVPAANEEARIGQHRPQLVELTSGEAGEVCINRRGRRIGAGDRGSRLLLNLDSEEEGELTIGCAGGMNTLLYLPLREEAGADGVGYEIRVAGLKGGHSGVDIHLQRGNAIKLLARALYAVSREIRFHLVRLEGGNAHNAIPREASATVLVPDDGGSDGFASRLERELESIREELGTVDPGMACEIGGASASGGAWDTATTVRALELITALPHGVMAMSDEIAGLVETSTNLAVVGRAGDRVKILLSSRSSVASALLALQQRIGATAALAGATAEEEGGYPAWQPDVSSHLLSIVKGVYGEIVGEPKVGAIHAGLECGIIGEKYEGMDMISFGPQIEFPHSPDEQVRIDSVGTFYVVLRAVLERLA